MQGGLLTNAEVSDLLAEQRRHRVEKAISDPSVEFFHGAVTKYVELYTHKEMRTIEVASAIKKQLDAQNFGLTEAETMQLINHCPQYRVEIHMVRADASAYCSYSPNTLYLFGP